LTTTTYQSISLLLEQFQSYAYRLGDIAQSRSYALSLALASRAESLTSSVQESDSQVWPFVTVPHFEVRGENARLETFAEILAFAPLLDNQTDKDAWSGFSVANQGWLQESYDRAVLTFESDPTAHAIYSAAASGDRKSPPDQVYRVEGNWDFKVEDSPGPWLPIWQISPPPPQPYPINFNMLSSPDFSLLFEYITINKVPVMSDRLTRHPIFGNLVAQYENITPQHNHNHSDHGRRLQFVNPTTTVPAENHTDQGNFFVLYPIFDTFDDEPNRKIEGIFLSLIRWDWILTDTLHEGTDELMAVITNNCGEQVYSYNVTGKDATFLGPGDLHDTQYTDEMIATPLNDLHGVTEEGKMCQFSVDVYPTQAFREAYMSSQAVIYTTILALAFAFTALFFLFYVRIVQRRQSKVMATAARTNAIVTSLFPSNVRDRIMKDAEEAVNNNKEMVQFLPGMGEAPKKKLKSFLDEESPLSEDQLVMFKTKPIADLFPETTVMFADLVGFTGKFCLFFRVFLSHNTRSSHAVFFFQLGVPFVNRRKFFSCSRLSITALMKLLAVAVFSKLRLLEIAVSCILSHHILLRRTWPHLNILIRFNDFRCCGRWFA
jgi:hypothetical protein